MKTAQGKAVKFPFKEDYIKAYNFIGPASTLSGRRFSAIREKYANEFKGKGGRLVAVTTDDTAQIAAVLLEAISAGLSVFLIRVAVDDKQLEQIGVTFSVDDKGFLHQVGTKTFDRKTPKVLIQTSGTTGVPKIAEHEIDRLLGRIKIPDTISLARWLMPYHPKSFAGLQVLLTFLSGGRELVYGLEHTVPQLVGLALQHNPTHISATPTFWRSLMMAGGQALPLKVITLGGEAVDQVLLDTLKRAFPQALIQHIYASTEAGALFGVKDGLAGFPAKWLESGTEGVRFRINGDQVLEVHSPRMMAGYSKNREIPLSEDGWLITGDIVDRKDDRVFFAGRQDSMINVGGSKVRPEEVETLACTVDGVHDALVYGIKNPVVGQLVAMDLVLMNGISEGQVRKKLDVLFAKMLERHKLPRIIKVVEKIEANQSGKKVRK